MRHSFIIPRRPTAPALASLAEADEDDDQQQEDIITAGFRGTAAAFQTIPASGVSGAGAAGSAENLAPAGADQDVPLRGDTPGLLRSMSAKLGQVRLQMTIKGCSKHEERRTGITRCAVSTHHNTMHQRSMSAKLGQVRVRAQMIACVGLCED
jgi:hypothetical protein